MQIQEFAQITNLSTNMVRFYEKIGLLPPPKQLDNGYRDYSTSDFELAKFIATARSLELSATDIQEILALRDRHDTPCCVILDLMEEKANDISRRIADLQKMETQLRKLHRLGLTFPTDEIGSKTCAGHPVRRAN